MKKINVLVVDDSAFMRKFISDLLSEDSRLYVTGTARNGEDALKKIRELKPDVVTMDVEMPVKNGLEALKIIMQEQPLPVVMLSSTTSEGTENALTAIQYGAIDFIAKPSGSISLDLDKIKNELISKVISASEVKRKHLEHFGLNRKISIKFGNNYSKIELNETSVLPEKIRKDLDPLAVQSLALHSKTAGFPLKKLVCIGTSTGGPRALERVLTKLPEDLDAGILIVQHMPAGFTKSLANRLNAMCRISVEEAQDGDLVKKGTAYIAPGGFHLKVKQTGANLSLKIDQTEIRNGHRPAVDVLFESVSCIEGYQKLAVIMTGMGSDGSSGLKTLKEKDRFVKAIAESEETSIVFGMPKAAIAANLIDEILDVDQIAASIMKFV